MRTVGVIQARMGSTRLPGKVLQPLCGRTVMSHVIERVRASGALDHIVVATTAQPQDDSIVGESVAHNVAVFRGAEEDVLDRFHGATRGADIVVRVTADCPLLDPLVLREMVKQFHTQTATAVPIDYLSNVVRRTFPRGLDVEVFTFLALDRAHREAREAFEREHVTPYIHRHPELFAIEHFTRTPDLSAHRWTLDTAEDYAFIHRIYRTLHKEGEIFSTDEILHLLRVQPELSAINAHVEQTPHR